MRIGPSFPDLLQEAWELWLRVVRRVAFFGLASFLMPRAASYADSFCWSLRIAIDTEAELRNVFHMPPVSKRFWHVATVLIAKVPEALIVDVVPRKTGWIFRTTEVCPSRTDRLIHGSSLVAAQ